MPEFELKPCGHELENSFLLKHAQEHEATFQRFPSEFGPAILKVGWGKPQSSTYRACFLLHGDTLVVTGDMYEAVYRWYGTQLSWQFVCTCNIGYFAEKCRAGNGHNGRGWSPHHAHKALVDHLEMLRKDRSDDDGKAVTLHEMFEGALGNNDVLVIEYLKSVVGTVEELESFLSGYDKVFGNDYYELLGAWNDYAVETRMHLCGLNYLWQLIEYCDDAADKKTHIWFAVKESDSYQDLSRSMHCLTPDGNEPKTKPPTGYTWSSCKKLPGHFLRP